MNSQTRKSSVQIKFLDNPLTLQKENKLEQLQSTSGKEKYIFLMPRMCYYGKK